MASPTPGMHRARTCWYVAIDAAEIPSDDTEGIHENMFDKGYRQRRLILCLVNIEAGHQLKGGLGPIDTEKITEV